MLYGNGLLWTDSIQDGEGLEGRHVIAEGERFLQIDGRAVWRIREWERIANFGLGLGGRVI